MQKIEVKIWGIHSSALSEIDSKFLSKVKPCVAIGWNKVGDLSKIPADREIFKEIISKGWLSRSYHN